MNRLEIIGVKSIYPLYTDSYDEIVIDGSSLDTIFDRMLPGNNISGLVSPVGGWLIDKIDELYFWNRITQDGVGLFICPLLICPDDMDYSCTTVMVRIRVEEEFVFWPECGIRVEYTWRKYKLMNQGISWSAIAHPLKFKRAEYFKTIKDQKEKRLGVLT